MESGLAIIWWLSVATVAVVVWYRWEVVRALIGDTWRTLKKHDVERRAQEAYYRQWKQEATVAEVKPPLLQLIRAGQRAEEWLLVVQNEGGFGQNLRVEAEGNAEATWQPETVWRKGQTGTLRLRLPSPAPRAVRFRLHHQDASGSHQTQTYVWSPDPPTLALLPP